MQLLFNTRPNGLPIRAILAASAVALQPAPALAFACYVGASPAGFIAVHKRASSHSQVVARLTEFMMVSEGRRMREREGWILVRWSKAQLSQADFKHGKGDGKGWIRREEIRGECED